MSLLLKSLFTFNSSHSNELQIYSQISKVESLLRELDRQKQNDLPLKLKTLLNAAFFQEKGQSLYQQIYKIATIQSHVEWVPVITKSVNLFSSGSTFMKVILEAPDYKMPIEKHFIPYFLFKNNLLNENTGYQSISNSISGLMVPILDYVFIRLLHAIHEAVFIFTFKEPNEQYESDDIYFNISRNPFLLLLRNYLEFFSTNERHMKRLAGNIKMFFVDQILLKHRINKSSNYLKDFSFFSDKCKIKPHYLLVIYLFLQKGRAYFDEKYPFFHELIERFQTLLESQNQIFFRFLFRIFLFGYSKNSIQNRVIDQLAKANENEGVFELKRYSTSQFTSSINYLESKQTIEFNQSKTLLLKLLEKDQNLILNGKVHFSTIRTLGCCLELDKKLNKNFSQTRNSEESDSLRTGSEAASLQIAIQKIQSQTMIYLKKKSFDSNKPLTKSNEQKILSEINLIKLLYMQIYNRKIQLPTIDDHKETYSTAQIGTKGNSEDFTFSVETYKRDIELNCWQVPLKESEFKILYDLFYALAKKIDRMFPGAKPGQDPRINLRYFSNPFVFLLAVIFLSMFFKILF